MEITAINTVQVAKWHMGRLQHGEDHLAIEEPLEIRLMIQDENGAQEKSVSITMRTPGHDEALAAGFLFTEGIIRSSQEVEWIRPHAFLENIVTVKLAQGTVANLGKLERNFYTTSSCGVCGKTSLQAIRVAGGARISETSWKVKPDFLCGLPSAQRSQQDVFEVTGGLHAAALFDLDGNLLLLREDVGRHNALDKLIGQLLLENRMPLDNAVLLLSGRASFELMQKAVMAGIRLVAAVGAPSSLAVDLAKEFGICLVGFLRDNRFNIYTCQDRIALD